MLSHSNFQRSHPILRKRTINGIKAMSLIDSGQKWFFNGCLLTFPQTIVVRQQIKQAIFVFEQLKPQQLLIVVLSEPAVRKYCNILKPFCKFKFINGLISKSYLNNIYVLMTNESQIQIIEGNEQRLQKSLLSDFQSSRAISNEINNSSRKQISLKIANKHQISNQDSSSSQTSEQSIKFAKSQKIEIKRQIANEQLIGFCGTVINCYEVGKGKINHGCGYKIQQFFSNAIYEVVIWSEMACGPLKKGESYQFKKFRPHKKHNLEISYHSNPHYSTIIPLL